MIQHIMPLGTAPGSQRSIEKGMRPLYYNDANMIAPKQDAARDAKGYIFYQPGDQHYASHLKKIFRSLFIRIGDLHHLHNPILKTFEFLDSIYEITEAIYLNTNPALLPLFRLLYPYACKMPISELTIADGILAEAKQIKKRLFSTEARKRVAYIGPINSAYHPRRSYWINALLKDDDIRSKLDVLPTTDPITWLNTCMLYDTIISPTLNSQWSHNLFVPNLAGSRILTDCQSIPTYSYYHHKKTKELLSCQCTYSLISLRNAIREIREAHAEMRQDIATNAIESLETADQTREMIFHHNKYRSSPRKTKLSKESPQSTKSLIVSSNIFEVLQEIARVMIIYDSFTVDFNANVLFTELSTYFKHPRIIYRIRNLDSHVGGSHVEMRIKGNRQASTKVDFLACIKVDLTAITVSPLRFGPNSFDPQCISSFNQVCRATTKTIGGGFQPAIFKQRLLENIEVQF